MTTITCLKDIDGLKYSSMACGTSWHTVGHEWLDLHEFNSIEHAQHLATEWLYYNELPNSAVGGIPPRKVLQAA